MKKEGRLMAVCLVQLIDLRPSGGLEIPLVLRFQCLECVTHCKMKKFVRVLYYYRYTGTKADSRDEEPKEEICFSDEE